MSLKILKNWVVFFEEETWSFLVCANVKQSEYVIDTLVR